ncbi:hypothetical protein Tco_1430390 [Tanacetum coccineum]
MECLLEKFRHCHHHHRVDEMTCLDDERMKEDAGVSSLPRSLRGRRAFSPLLYCRAAFSLLGEDFDLELEGRLTLWLRSTMTFQFM